MTETPMFWPALVFAVLAAPLGFAGTVVVLRVRYGRWPWQRSAMAQRWADDAWTAVRDPDRGGH